MRIVLKQFILAQQSGIELVSDKAEKGVILIYPICIYAGDEGWVPSRCQVRDAGRLRWPQRARTRPALGIGFNKCRTAAFSHTTDSLGNDRVPRHDIGAVQVHRIAAWVQDAVGGGRKGHVVVHTDPVDRDSPRFRQVEDAIGRLVEVDERLVSFHDIQLNEGADGFDLEVEVVVDHHDYDSEELRADLAHTLAGATGATAVVVHVEPAFAYAATPDPD